MPCPAFKFTFYASLNKYTSDDLDLPTLKVDVINGSCQSYDLEILIQNTLKPCQIYALYVC